MSNEIPEKFNLFVFDDEVWEFDHNGERAYAGPWPVRVYLKRHDGHDGKGTRLGELAGYGKVLKSYKTKADHKYTTYAVLFEIASAEDFKRLNDFLCADDWYNFCEDCFSPPAPLDTATNV